MPDTYQESFVGPLNEVLQTYMSRNRCRIGPAMDALSDAIKLSTDTVFKWRNQTTKPKQPRVIEDIAAFGVTACGLDQDWVERLLVTSDYAANADALIARLFAPPVALVPHNLPPKPVSFHGREAELDELHSLLASDSGRRAVCISGLAGVGKSRLLLKLAWDVVERRVPLAEDDAFDRVVWTQVRRKLLPPPLSLDTAAAQSVEFDTTEKWCQVIRDAVEAQPARQSLRQVSASGGAGAADAPVGNALVPAKFQVMSAPVERWESAWADLSKQARVLFIVDDIDDLPDRDDCQEGTQEGAQDAAGAIGAEDAGRSARRIPYQQVLEGLRSFPATWHVVVTSRSPLEWSDAKVVSVEPLDEAAMRETIADKCRALALTPTPLKDDVADLVKVSRGAPSVALAAVRIAASVHRKPARIVREADRYLGDLFWQYFADPTVRQLIRRKEHGALLILRLLGFYASSGATVDMLVRLLRAVAANKDVQRLVDFTAEQVPTDAESGREVIEQLKEYGLVVPVSGAGGQSSRLTLTPVVYALVRGGQARALDKYLESQGFQVRDVLAQEWKRGLIDRALALTGEHAEGVCPSFLAESPNFIAASQWCLRQYPDMACLDDLMRMWVGDIAAPADRALDDTLAAWPSLGCVGAGIPPDHLELLRLAEQHLTMLRQFIALATATPFQAYYACGALLAHVEVTARLAIHDRSYAQTASRLLAEVQAQAEELAAASGDAGGMGEPFYWQLKRTAAQAVLAR